MDALLALALGGALVAVSFTTGGGVVPGSDGQLGANTWMEIVLLALAVVAGGALLLYGRGGRRWGTGTVAVLAALTAYTAISITWSYAPDTSWRAADQALAYLAAFGAAAAVARLAPERWRALPEGLALGATAVAGWSLLAKVFPATLAAQDPYGRLDLPLHYWNALGLLAGMGIPSCLWAATRRDSRAVIRALAIPPLAVLWAVVILSYSRSALAAALVGCGLWLVLAPVRLRSVLALAVGGAGAAAIAAWALARPALTADNQPLAARDPAGHTFGWVILAALIATALIGALALSVGERRRLSQQRRRALGIALLCLLALVPVGLLGALAESHRGLTGEVSHLWSELTSTSSHIGDTPGRLAAVANSRPRYWKEGFTVGEHAPLQGVGALAFETAALRYRGWTLLAGQAHSYLVETFADLGAIGLALSLALLISWAVAAARPLTPARLSRRTARADAQAPAGDRASDPAGDRASDPAGDQASDPAGDRASDPAGDRASDPPGHRPPAAAVLGAVALERAGLAALAGAAVAFGVQSAIDWSWYIPALSVPALVCAGWLAGRGPLTEATGRSPRRRRLLEHPRLPLALTGLLLAALAGGYAIYQPLAAVQDDGAAIQADSAGRPGVALSDARAAVASDPLSLEARGILAGIDSAAGQPAAARSQLLQAVREQPQNWQSWQLLGQYDLRNGRPGAAARELRRAARLDLYNPSLTAEAAAAGDAGRRTPAVRGRR